MTLEELGYSTELEAYRLEHHLESLEVARVVSEHRERYVVKTDTAEYEAEILGNLRFSAQDRSDFPAVGDWVAISPYDEDKALIHAVYPRSSSIERQAVGRHGEKQIIATNIDYALIVLAVDRDFSVNRIERYLTICNASRVEPIILLNKIDLINEDEQSKLIAQIQERIQDIPVLAISNESHAGIEQLSAQMLEGKTYCLLGSSGVGKSTLVNNLSGKQLMETNTISTTTNRGRHVTSHRELIVLNNGALLIDNPGLREVGITESAEGLESTFHLIYELAEDCKYTDCTHTSEAGCAVLEAVSDGKIDESTYENYLKMLREQQHFETSLSEKKRKDKMMGKLMKDYKKTKKKNDL